MNRIMGAVPPDEVGEEPFTLLHKGRPLRRLYPEQSAEAGPQCKRKDQQTHQVHNELFGADRTHGPGFDCLAGLTSEHVSRRAAPSGHHGRHPLRLRVHFGNHVAGEVGPGGVKIDLLPDNVSHLLLDAAILIGQDAEHQRRERAECVFEDGIGQRGLGPDVVVNQGLVDPGFIGDFLGTGPGGAFAEEDGMSNVVGPASS
jgi:hypothetical protein